MKNKTLIKKTIFTILGITLIGAGVFMTQTSKIEAADTGNCSQYEQEYSDLQKEFDAANAELNSAQAELNSTYDQIAKAQARSATSTSR